ncbi:MAG: hypothetical protein PUK81_07655 [Firmicutes bacterium]|nr:hypothetical protein [Bacillota bacterium]
MHINWKRILLVSGLAVLAMLSGCQEPGGRVTEQTDGLQPEDINPTHIYEEVREGFLIDAEVTGAPEGVTPKVYVGTLPTYRREAVDAFLSHVGDSISEIISDERIDESYSFCVTCTSGGRLVCRDSVNNNFEHWVFNYFNPVTDRFYDSAVLYCTPDEAKIYSQYKYNMNLYEEEKDFAFASAAEAEKEVRDTLELLGVQGLVLQKTLYLDHSALEKAYGQELVQRLFLGDDGASPAEYEERSWSEADDGYMFMFCAGVDGIPMMNSGWTSQTYTYGPSQVLVRINETGITYISAHNPWMFGEVAEQPEHLLTASEALAVAKERLRDVILGHDIIIDRANLLYYSIQDRDRWTLVPVWEIAVLHKGSTIVDGEAFDDYTYIVVNAVTGKEIV